MFGRCRFGNVEFSKHEDRGGAGNADRLARSQANHKVYEAPCNNRARPPSTFIRHTRLDVEERLLSWLASGDQRSLFQAPLNGQTWLSQFMRVLRLASG